ncbi:hypothetical protein WN944_004641 [Citrus x changshan-huyou]|uniref:Uncharacterized protein n=1 Tax=Citrus x changshan-huyou TaxID=2935761 RepID=A0AAP0M4B9_9ROSI
MEKVASTVHVNTKVLFTVFIVTSAGFVSSDFNQGRKECGDQLADFSACLPFLVKDRNDPRHGFKMNATLALSLPSVRHAPAKVSDCPALLNPPSNPTDAQVLEQLAANSGGNNSTTVTGNVSSDPCTKARSAHFLLVFHSTSRNVKLICLPH